METQIALLRGVNVGGHRKVPMADLRKLSKKIGLLEAQTHLASGNVIFKTEGPAKDSEARLEAEIHEIFGFEVEVVVLTHEEILAAHSQNPFPSESLETPQNVMICFGKSPGTDAELATLRRRVTGLEQVERVNGNFWFYYSDGAGRSKLGFRKNEGCWTARNWRTIEALVAKAEA
jgi:uncharacterized protein (DUF1697 family)